jgi:AsmA protein
LEKFTRAAIAATLALMVAGALVLLPLLFLDKQSIRLVTERALSRATGLNARIFGDIEISVLGGPRAEFGRVYLTDPNFDVTINITSMSASLKYFPILAQRIILSDLRLTGPRMAIMTSANIETQFDTFKRVIDGLGQIDGLEIDAITITNGRLLLLHPGQATQVADAIDLKLKWNSGARQLSARGQSTWRGRSVAIEAQFDDPLALLNAGHSQASVELSTEDTRAQFDGVITASDPTRLSGNFDLQSQDPDKTLSWVLGDWPTGHFQQPVTIAATGSLDFRGTKFDTISIDTEGQTAEGSVEISWSKDRPLVHGTLAFDTLRVQNPALQTTPLSAVPDKILAALPLDLIQFLDIDIRLSAVSLIGEQPIAQNVAASILTSGDRVIIDVGDAQVFGGAMRFTLAINGLPDVFQANFRVSGDDLDGATLSLALGATNPLSGRLSGTAEWNGHGVMPTILGRSITGRVSIEVAEPQWTGLDVEALLKARLSGSSDRPKWISELPDRLSKMTLDILVRPGVVSIPNAEFEASGWRATLAGRIRLSDGGLDLSGTLEIPKPKSDTADQQPATVRLPLAIGGSGTGAKIISPVKSGRKTSKAN